MPFCYFCFQDCLDIVGVDDKQQKEEEESEIKDTDWKLVERSHIFNTQLLFLSHHKNKTWCNIFMQFQSLGINAVFCRESYWEKNKYHSKLPLKSLKYVYVCHVKTPGTILNLRNICKIALMFSKCYFIHHVRLR